MRGIVDSGSQVTFITRAQAKKLNLKPFNASVSVQGLDRMSTKANSAVECQVTSIHNIDQSIKINAVIVDKICDTMPTVSLPPGTRKQFSNLLLADPEYFESGTVNILLGADIFPYMYITKRSNCYFSW